MRARTCRCCAVFPPGGTRVLAYPAPHFAVSDGGAAGRAAGGDGDYGFAYLNLRMGRGRSEAVQQGVGRALMAVAKVHFEPMMAAMHVGVTLQIDVGAEGITAHLREDRRHIRDADIEALMAAAQAHFEPLLAAMHVGVTLQIDVGAEVFDAKHSTLHPLFNKSA